jgi:hypothetical protein
MLSIDHRRWLAAAHSVIAVGAAARIHYLVIYHAAASARPGLYTALLLALILALFSALVGVGVRKPGVINLYAGASLYAGIAVLLGSAYRHSPWDIQLGNDATFSGLALWCLASLIAFRKEEAYHLLPLRPVFGRGAWR